MQRTSIRASLGAGLAVMILVAACGGGGAATPTPAGATRRRHGARPRRRRPPRRRTEAPPAATQGATGPSRTSMRRPRCRRARSSRSTWTGPNAAERLHHDRLAGATKWTNEAYFNTNSAQPQQAHRRRRRPATYELWYVSGADKQILARRRSRSWRSSVPGRPARPTRSMAGREFEVDLDRAERARRLRDDRQGRARPKWTNEELLQRERGQPREAPRADVEAGQLRALVRHRLGSARSRSRRPITSPPTS